MCEVIVMKQQWFFGDLGQGVVVGVVEVEMGWMVVVVVVVVICLCGYVGLVGVDGFDLDFVVVQ